MIVRATDEVTGTDRQVNGVTWTSSSAHDQLRG